MDKLIDILKSLSDETRLRILNLLFEKELCVCDIMAILQISQAKASRHLIYLKNAGLIKDRRSAQWMYYSVIKNEKYQFIEALIFNNLRNIELYKNDLVNLTERYKNNTNYCE
jgi:Predicted transcriptional regulators